MLKAQGNISRDRVSIWFLFWWFLLDFFVVVGFVLGG